jgi:hypothetical protein
MSSRLSSMKPLLVAREDVVAAITGAMPAAAVAA